MAKVRNVLFCMTDQLRWDYLSCYGHRRLATPHIDQLARIGVQFSKAYCSSPVCGPSRMSFYTGRTTFSHGSSWNLVPLAVGEWTVGDYLKDSGIRVALVGKTHMMPDRAGMKRLGLDPHSDLGIRLAQCGFEPYERDDGDGGKIDPDLRYNRWLRSLGYESDNPWADYANSGLAPDGSVASGWSLRNARYPARVAEPHSETAYMTDRALDFLKQAGDRPWVLHLSYIKPHWPLIAPDPYHRLYGPEDLNPPIRSEDERKGPHPVMRAFMDMGVSKTFSDDLVRRTSLPVYMGLIKQIDDHFGRLMQFLESSGRLEDTMIIFTSDHGDYFGDHWLGEKELFHEPSARIPLLIYDPDPAADCTRGMVDDRLVEAIDIAPTLLEALDVNVTQTPIEGRSVLSGLRSAIRPMWREAAFSEIDYSFYAARTALRLEPVQARAYMMRTDRWKYVYFKGFRPQLFDLHNDPQELIDLGASHDHRAVCAEHQALLLDRLTDRYNRVTMTDDDVKARTDCGPRMGIHIGRW